MIYVAAAESDGSAIVDISTSDFQDLSTACSQVAEAVESDDFVAQTGYTKHAYDYLFVWMVENQLGAEQRLPQIAASHARSRDRLGPPTDSELLLATKIGDNDNGTVRWNLTVETLLMFDVAIRETLDYFDGDDPPYYDLEFIMGTKAEDLQTRQQEIKDILAAVELAAEGKPIR